MPDMVSDIDTLGRLDTCPMCGTEAVARCRCMIGDRICGNWHHWHLCLAHDNLRVVVGESDHSHPTHECSCPAWLCTMLLPAEPQHERHAEALRLAAVLEGDPR